MPNNPSQKLISWYQLQKRELPWREKPEPYAVWIAEIMAQQTRLETMLPYFDRWMEHYPNVRTLASADLQELLKLWEGLGYYQRVRNIHQTAKLIVNEHQGQLPKNYEDLLALPGIGPYTAGAIASVAFGADQPAVDGNAIRVLSRFRNIDMDVSSSEGRQLVWQAAREMLPAGQASDFNQALMDLGATICLPRNPKCDHCPLSKHCEALQLGIQETRPVKGKNQPIPTRHYAALVIQQGTKFFLLKRPERGLLGGLWEFPNVEIPARSTIPRIKQQLQEHLEIRFDKFNEKAILKHQYSHFHAQVRVFSAQWKAALGEAFPHESGKWIDQQSLPEIPMGKIDRSIAKMIANDLG